MANLTDAQREGLVSTVIEQLYSMIMVGGGNLQTIRNYAEVIVSDMLSVVYNLEEVDGKPE